MYSMSRNTMYVGGTTYMTHQERKYITRHIRKYRMYAISGITIQVWKTIREPHQDIQYFARHMRKYKTYATDTGCAISGITTYVMNNICAHQEIQYVRFIRNYWYTPHQKRWDTVGHISRYRNNVTSRDTGCTPPQEILYIYIYTYVTNNIYVISGETIYCTTYKVVEE